MARVRQRPVYASIVTGLRSDAGIASVFEGRVYWIAFSDSMDINISEGFPKMKSASISNHRVLLAGVSMALLILGGCAAQTVEENDTGEKDNARLTVTGSRIPIRDTTSAIGVKTVDKETLERMMRVNPGPDGK